MISRGFLKACSCAPPKDFGQGAVGLAAHDEAHMPGSPDKCTIMRIERDELRASSLSLFSRTSIEDEEPE